MPDRIQLQRKAGWRLPLNAKTVARPTIYGNPWRVTKNWNVLGPDGASIICLTREQAHSEAVRAYRIWLVDGHYANVEWLPAPKLAELDHARERILNHLPELRGWNLACWCPPECACHGTVLLELANPEDTAA